MHVLHRDQDIIEKFLDNEMILIKEFFKDEEFVTFIANTLRSLRQNKTQIVTVTGGPGSGKSTFVKNLLQILATTHIKVDSLTTEDFNLLDRSTRDNLIAKGSTPLEFKDFQYLNELIKKVRNGQRVQAPKYDRKTGIAIAAGRKKFPHTIASNIDFLIVEGDFQPVKDPDLKIYFHVPTDIRMKNRITRDLEKEALKNEKEVVDSFAFRQESQYYPYTFPQHTNADLFINISAEESKNGEFAFYYHYKIHKKI